MRAMTQHLHDARSVASLPQVNWSAPANASCSPESASNIIRGYIYSLWSTGTGLWPLTALNPTNADPLREGVVNVLSHRRPQGFHHCSFQLKSTYHA